MSPHSILHLLTDLARYRFQTLLVISAVAAAWVFPRAGANWFHRVEQRLSKLARRRGLAVLTVGLLALAARAAVLPIRPIPYPFFDDEFSYLLAADTFAHGRLTNPPHPMWIHFESIHVLQKPTYMSKYYPGQGLILAAGQAVAGHPFWGVWFSMGLACAALCWMLQGWMPPGWALLGGLLSVLRLAIFSYWGNSYWGGAVAAVGGALVLGALPRLQRRPRARNALVLGLGLAILASSRPYEGLFLGLGIAIAMAAWLWGKDGPTWGLSFRRVVAPLLLVLILAGAALGYYCWRLTGSPFRIPYVVYTQTYEPVPYFPWQEMKSIPEYHHEVLRNFNVSFSFEDYRTAREHPLELIWTKARKLFDFYFGAMFAMPIVLLLLVGRGKFFRGLTKPGKVRRLLLLCALPFVGMALPIYFNPHYAAPLTAAFYALVLMAMRYLRLWRWRGQPVGLQLVRVIPVLALVTVALHAGVLVRQCLLFAPSGDLSRGSILTRLPADPNGHLVLVRYNREYEIGEAWVYNDADIDAAKVVWAWDMGASANEELIRYYKDRRVWLLEADEWPAKLLPYKP